MAASSSRNTIARQWELLAALPSRGPGITAAELRLRLVDAGFTTTKRTIERDLNDMSLIFPIICDARSTPYGWYWRPGSAISLPGISLADALTLRLVEGGLKPLLPSFIWSAIAPRFMDATNKLEALSIENPAAGWADKVVSCSPGFPLLAPTVSDTVLTALQGSLLNDNQVSVRYYAAHKNTQIAVVLNPLGLVQKGINTYLVATVNPHEDVRTFALHRFLTIDELDVRVVKPTDFSLRDFVDDGGLSFGSAEVISLRAWVDVGFARLIEETPISEDMQLKPTDDRGFMLSATVQASWELNWWILSHAGAIRITEPAWLAEYIQKRLEKGLMLQTGSA